MVTVLEFIFLGILCLMFLGMIYGEKNNILGMLEGRFLEPVRRFLSGAWNELCRAFDLSLLFVTEHASWVMATASGGLGLFVISFLLFSGIAEDAAARHRDLATPLNAGSVIDLVPAVDTVRRSSAILRASHAVEMTKFDESDFLAQRPGTYVVFKRPELDRPVRRRRDAETEVVPWHPDDRIHRPLEEQPALRVSFDRLPQHSGYFDDETQTIAAGRLIEAMPLRNIITQAISRLQRDDWGMSFGGRAGGPLLTDLQPESTALEVRTAVDGIRVIPGDAIAEHDLRIEKLFPAESSGSEVTVEISLLNTGEDVVSGLIVREYLQRNTRIRGSVPQALFRDDTLTWIVNELRPFEEQVLRFTAITTQPPARSSGRTTFESATEVSAATAVSNRTVVRDDSLRLQPSESRRPVAPLPSIDESTVAPTSEIAGRPDVRLRIDEPLDPVKVGQTIEINFVVRNFGSEPAEGVGLRVTLDQGLKHHKLSDDDPERVVVNSVRRLEPGESRSIPLRIRASRPGQFRSEGEMIFEGKQITSDSFRIVAEPIADPFPTAAPIR